MLTASHCIDDNGGQDYPPAVVGFGSNLYSDRCATYVPDQWFTHPDWNPDQILLGSTPDLALIYFQDPILGIEPAKLFHGTIPDTMAATIYHVGYGTTGHASGAKTYDGQKRGGQAAVFGTSSGIYGAYDGYFGTIFSVQFGYRHLGAGLGPGDSGGSAYYEVNGEVFLAGVHASASRYMDYNSTSNSVKVAKYADWIEATMASMAVPEPSAVVSICPCLVLILCRRRFLSRPQRS